MGRLPAILSKDDCSRLMTAFEDGENAFRNNLIMRILYATGLRRSEMADLRFCDISFDEGTALVRAGKGDKDRYVCIDKVTLAMIRQHQKGKRPEDTVAGVRPLRVAEIVEEAGRITGASQKYEAMGRRFSTHCLRHAFATHCYENGMRTLTLKKLLGHKFIATTLMYVYTATSTCALEYEKTNPFTAGQTAPPDSRL